MLSLHLFVCKAQYPLLKSSNEFRIFTVTILYHLLIWKKISNCFYLSDRNKSDDKKVSDYRNVQCPNIRSYHLPTTIFHVNHKLTNLCSKRHVCFDKDFSDHTILTFLLLKINGEARVWQCQFLMAHIILWLNLFLHFLEKIFNKHEV